MSDSFPPSESRLVSLPTGISLQTDLWRPSTVNPGEYNKLAVLLHPWSWLGGRKEDPYAFHQSSSMVVSYSASTGYLHPSSNHCSLKDIMSSGIIQEV